MLVCEDPAVDELLHFRKVAAKASEGVAARIFGVPYHAQEEVVRGYSVASGPHRFFT